MCKINFYLQKNVLIMCYFYFNRFERENDFYQVFYHCVKTNCKGKKSRVLKTHKKITFILYGNLVDLLRTWITIKTHIDILKMMQHQEQNISMEWFRCHRNKKSSADPNFILKVLPDDGITEDINSLDSKQREVSNVVHPWAKGYIKYNGIMVMKCLCIF